MNSRTLEKEWLGAVSRPADAPWDCYAPTSCTCCRRNPGLSGSSKWDSGSSDATWAGLREISNVFCVLEVTWDISVNAVTQTYMNSHITPVSYSHTVSIWSNFPGQVRLTLRFSRYLCFLRTITSILLEEVLSLFFVGCCCLSGCYCLILPVFSCYLIVPFRVQFLDARDCFGLASFLHCWLLPTVDVLSLLLLGSYHIETFKWGE